LEVKECEEIPWWKKRKEIRYVKVEDVIAPISTAYWFYGMYRCTNMNLTKLNTSKVTDMSGMFLRCEDLTSLDVSNFSMVNYDGMR
jgi:surface protein